MNNLGLYEGFNETEIRVVEELSQKGGRSYTEIADACGISKRHLYRIRQKPYIKAAVRQRVMEELEDDVPDIIGTLRKNMKKGDFRSTELLAKMAGLLVERQEVTQRTTIEDNRYQDMSSEEIDKEIETIEQELKLIQGGGGDSK
ncbi:hypothetical protein C6W27_09010 [Bacillus paralicheniformis]|uniref:phBC6A51 family helix-turn-helix protein n=1 Tax=Bacillus paralicheniformis TaxID=1648923 RepID=UPI000D041E9A|nr:phBC6A51 family helix-turn-helix protein [Bacillus paralicheniformis]PRS16530.1 hypothetical protein C6W27_09010 [Bacillus paralicheniformis]